MPIERSRPLKLTAADPAVLSRVDAVVLDIEGCLTDGLKLIGDDGNTYLRYSAIDGLGVWMLGKAGVRVALVSASIHPSMKMRAKDMEVAEYAVGITDKALHIRTLADRWQVELQSLCMMGDDLWDIPAMDLVGISVCPSSAQPAVRERANFVTDSAGGDGAVRELANSLLKAKGLSTADMLKFLIE